MVIFYKKIKVFTFSLRLVAAIAFMLFMASFTPAIAEDGLEAEDNRPYKFIQGFVSEESVGGFMLNEQWRVFFLPNTMILSSSETELAQESLKGHKWVYVEGPVNSYGNIEAEFIYLLPRIINRDERKAYPFIKIP